jgi:hypothetical protein
MSRLLIKGLSIPVCEAGSVKKYFEKIPFSQLFHFQVISNNTSAYLYRSNETNESLYPIVSSTSTEVIFSN